MTVSEIRVHISKRQHWKKGDEWWAEHLNEPLDKIEKARSTKTTTNAGEGVKTDIIEDDQLYQTLEEFLDEHGISEDDITNVWYKQRKSGTYFSVETRRYKEDDLDFDPVKAFRDHIEEYSPPEYTLPKARSTHKQRAAIINLFDAHLDKIASLDETDSQTTIEDNEILFEAAFDELLESIAIKNPEVIIIPLGNDFWHTNNSSLGTKKGTPLADRVHETDMPAFRRGLNLIRRCIDKARQIAPVELFFISGNHDKDRVMYLLECLMVAYENQSDVTVHDSRKARQYYRYGSWLCGFTHGDNQRKAKDLPSLMSTDKDARKHWSDIKQGVYFLGDIHHERRYDYRGCSVLYLRSTHPADDQWHWNKGFTAVPATAYGFVYDKDGTREVEFKVNI